MKQLKYLSMIALALVFGLTSCSNDDESGQGSGEAQSVYIKLDQPTGRAAGPSADGEIVEVSSGYLYFLNANNGITKSIDISEDISDLTKNGKTYTEIPGNSSFVVMVGNTDGKIDKNLMSKATNLNDIEAFILSVETQNEIKGVTVYSNKGVIVKGAESNTAELKLTPVPSRIELQTIKAGGNLDSFKVKGIYMNYTYKTAPIQGNGVDNQLIEMATEFPEYVNIPGVLKDTHVDGLSLGSDQVWGYNLLANDKIPHIVIHITDVEVKDGYEADFSGNQYVTITGYKEGATVLERLAQGTIYKVSNDIDGGDLIIDEGDLTPTPEMKSISVTVTASVMKWKAVTVTPII